MRKGGGYAGTAGYRDVQLGGQVLEGLLDSQVLLSGQNVHSNELVEIREALCSREVHLRLQIALVPNEHAHCVGGEVLAVLNPLS